MVLNLLGDIYLPVKNRIVPLFGTMFCLVPLCTRNPLSTYPLSAWYVPTCRYTHPDQLGTAWQTSNGPMVLEILYFLCANEEKSTL